MEKISLEEFEDLFELSEEEKKELQEKAYYEVDTYEKAESLVSNIVFAQKRIEQRTKMIKKLKAKLDQRLKEMNKSDQSAIERMEEYVRPYCEQEIAKQKKKKSIEFINGKVGIRCSSSVVITDEEAIIKYCKENDIPAIKETISKSVIKPYLKKGGIEGAKIDDTTTFYIKPLETGLLE